MSFGVSTSKAGSAPAMERAATRSPSAMAIAASCCAPKRWRIPTMPAVVRSWSGCFREYGLPRTIRSDNGAPFASLGAGGLSRLGVWWVKLGITPERIEPGKPEQNGRHERMHKTLKAETATPPAANLAQQQARFERFRQEFNCERPHEALGQTAPEQHYTASLLRYPAGLEDPVYPADYQPRRVRSNGESKWAGEKIFLSAPLIGEVVGVKETEDGDGEIYFGPVPLAIIDRVTLQLRRSSPRRRAGQPSSRSTPAG